MKTFLKYVGCAILMIAFTSSCSTSFNIAKKRHSKGYYVDLGSDDFKYKSKARKVKAKVARDEASTNAETANASSTEEKSESADYVNSTYSNNSFVSDDMASEMELEEMSTSQKMEALKKKMSAADGESSDDLMLIVLIILALLIPPLAVYLKASALNSHFWINLILWLLGGGLWFGLGALGWLGGVFWLAAVVHAILYVLNKI